MRIAYFCFVVATFAALTGMGLGMHMGMSQDFALVPVHAHLNLLGWVTMALYGLYYRGSNSPKWFASIQVGVAALGFPMMTGGLALALLNISGDAYWVSLGEVLIVLGSLLTIAAMAIFLAVLVWDALKSSRTPRTGPS